MMFALSDAFWLGLFGVITLLIKEFSDRIRSKTNAAATQNVVTKVVTTSAAKQDEKLAVVAKQVEEVRKAANGITKVIGDAKLAQRAAEGTAKILQQLRDETKSPDTELIVKNLEGEQIGTIIQASNEPKKGE